MKTRAWQFGGRRWAGIVSLMLLAAVPAAAQMGTGAVQKVPVQPMTQSDRADDWVPGKARRGACVDATRIAAAEVMDHETVDIVLKGGQRWRIRLARECSQLTFYGGFYYRQAMAGQICAGRDQIMGRAGGECLVRQIVPLKLKRRG